MATRYWVGGSGNWSDAANHWAAASNGAPGAGNLPTASDDVVFDAASNVGTGSFTVTVDGTSASPSLCNSFSTGGAGGALDGAMTLSMGATAQLDCYGSLTLPATNFTWSGTSGALLQFVSTSVGNTITTNGVSLTNMGITFNGVGGGWTLGSALTTTTNGLTITAGAVSTANFNITTVSITIGSGSATRSLTLGSSTVTLSLSGTAFSYSGTNFTLTAGTSTITCSGASPTFAGGGLTFYNVSFTNVGSGTITINGANTYNNLTFPTITSTGSRNITLGANQTVNGTLTPSNSSSANRRMFFRSDTVGTQRTISAAAIGTMANVDFRDIVAAGAATPWSGTSIGNCLNNSNITFSVAKTVYWNLAGSQSWSATGWATTNNGTPAAANFPLAQDTATFTQAGSAGTVTIDAAWNIGTIQMADGVSNRTTAFTLASGTQAPVIYGNVTLFSSLTLTGTGTFSFFGQGVTQTVTSAGIPFTQPITVNAPSGTFKIADNLITGSNTALGLVSGTLDLNNKTLTCVAFSSASANTRSVAFGTGNITLTGNNATIWSTSTITGFTVTGTPVVNATYSGATGTRTITTAALSQANAISFNITAGTDTVAGITSVKNLVLTGFAGTLSNAARTIYGNLTIPAGVTFTAGTSATTFAATSGTQTITTNGVTLDFPITINASGATVQMQDALTMGSTRALTLTNGTFQLKAGVTSTIGSLATSGTNQKYLQSTVAGSQATLSCSSGTNSVSYVTIQDINATGGATWNAFYSNGNIDAGDNVGWNFGDSPANVTEFGMQLRSFTQPRRF